jgi:Peroxiredoxin
MQLVQLQKDLDKIAATGTQVVGISYDAVDALAGFAEKKKITFPLAVRPWQQDDHRVRAFEQGGQRQAGGHRLPGTMILDKNGIVRAKLFYNGPFKRHTTDELVKAAEAVK